jgi:hypothetical protein
MDIRGVSACQCFKIAVSKNFAWCNKAVDVSKNFRRKKMKRMRMVGCINVILFFLVGYLQAEELSVIHVTRSDKPVKVDGILDDAVWQEPPLEKEFIVYNPQFGEIFPHKTAVWISYDSKNLYFAMKCYDAEPNKIKTSVTKRDNIWADDWVGLSLDTMGDGQSTYGLYVNPNGIQGDILYTRSSGEDSTPDWVWESAGKITEEGYQVEIKLPLKSIRFKSGKEVEMRILFSRRISRLGIDGSWPARQPGIALFEIMQILSFRNIKPVRILEVLPSITYSSSRERDDNRQWLEFEKNTDVGIGIKYGITSSLTTELTINPDFSQVETDAFQVTVNRRYPIFFTEKRPFFMESAGFFNIAGTGGDFNMYTAVHTRRIVEPRWGAKLTGTIGKTTLGILTSSDRYPGQAWEDGINPDKGKSALFSIVRVKQSLGRGNYLGLIYSRRDFSERHNQVIGGDMQFHLSGPHNFLFSFLNSYTKNSAGTDVLSGNILTTRYSYESKSFAAYGILDHFSKNFQMDTAFYNRSGFTKETVYIGPNLVPSSKKLSWIKGINPFFWGFVLHDINTGMNDSYALFGLRFYFIKQGFFRIDYNFDNESWVNRTFHQQRFQVKGEIQLYKWLYLGGGYSYGDSIYYDPVNPYMGKKGAANFYFTLQPNKKFSESFSINYEVFDRAVTKEKVYDSLILNNETTYQFNKYFFIRGNIRYDSFDKNVLTDFLASFTLIPGTVVHIGYGSLYEERNWDTVNSHPFDQNKMMQTRQSFFFKASYLWRL